MRRKERQTDRQIKRDREPDDNYPLDFCPALAVSQTVPL